VRKRRGVPLPAAVHDVDRFTGRLGFAWTSKGWPGHQCPLRGANTVASAYAKASAVAWLWRDESARLGATVSTFLGIRVNPALSHLIQP
jgi:hypothetical protein